MSGLGIGDSGRHGLERALSPPLGWRDTGKTSRGAYLIGRLASILFLAARFGSPLKAGPARILGNLGWRGKSVFGKKLRETTWLGRR